MNKEVNPFIPMGAMTGKPDREQMRKILTAYRSVGIEQYLVYPRSGCELEYLSEEYLDTLAMICEEAANLKFSALWLYDEFNWPSGSCGKQIPHENPDFAMKFICAYNCNGKVKVEIRRNPDYTHLLNPLAVDRFIELTHEQYYKHLKPYFGNLIKGIFTDEPEIGYFGDASKDALFCMGYYDGLEDDYKELTGGDLFEDIAAGVRSNPEFYPAVCADLLGRQFRKVYIDKIRTWCDTHNIVMTGHMMNETHPERSRKSNGNILKVLSGMSLPGMDEINSMHFMFSCDWLTMATAMYAIEKQGNNGGLGELFALGPCDLNFTRLNKMLYLVAAFGVDHYVLAISPVDSRGCAHKPKWYHSFSLDQPQLEAYDKWSETGKHTAVLARKSRSYEVAVRYGNGSQRLLDLLIALTRHQISWCLLDNDEEAPEDIPFVFGIHPDGIIRDEKTFIKSTNLDYLWDVALKEKMALTTFVCEENGKMVEDLFVRRYSDKSILVVDMSGTDRKLFLHRNNEIIPFTLYAHGVAEFTAEQTAGAVVPEKAALAVLDPDCWQLEFDRKHLLRVNFNENNSAVIELPTKQDLRLAIRQYMGPVEIEFNGKVLSGGENSTNLPETFKNLYQEYDLGTLPAGKYSVKLLNNAVEYPFLPLAVFIGSDLPYYVGSIVQKTNFMLPENAAKFFIKNVPDPGAVELFVNGKSLGKVLQKPYLWDVPAGLTGENAEVTLVFWTSVGGFFGTAFPGKDEASKWGREHRSPKYLALNALTVEII